MANPSSDSEPKPRPYNPYEELNVNPQLLKLYNLPTSPEYLFEEEALRKRRSWGENLTFYTGFSYLGGAVVGGAKGTFDGLRSAEYGESLKVRVSRVLNSGGHTGRRLGNSAGMLGLIYGGLDSLIFHYRDTDDVLGSVLAGLGTGSIYRIASGVRSAAIAGALGGVLVGAAVSGKQVLKRYVPI